MGERSIRLASDLQVHTLNGTARVLAEEAVLITERLENLDAQLQGDPAAWFGIASRMPETVAEVTVDRALTEARQQALALATVLKTLAAVKTDAPAVPVKDTADEVAAKRAAKLAAAQAAEV